MSSRSFEIKGINLFTNEKNGRHELWATKPDGKTMLVFDSEEVEHIIELKDAIEFAINAGERTFSLGV
jgi:hypothetical protein